MIEQAFAARRRNPLFYDIDLSRHARSQTHTIRQANVVHPSVFSARSRAYLRPQSRHKPFISETKSQHIAPAPSTAPASTPPFDSTIPEPAIVPSTGPNPSTKAAKVAEPTATPPAVPASTFMSFATDSSTTSPFGKLRPEGIEHVHTVPVTNTKAVNKTATTDYSAQRKDSWGSWREKIVEDGMDEDD